MKYLFIVLCTMGFSNFLVAQESVLYPNEVAYGLDFGKAVTVFNDYIAIGAPRWNYENDLGEAVYVFKKNGMDWIQEARLIVSETFIDNGFGLSLSGHNDYLLIGASGDDENGESSGAAYVFKKEGNDWVEEAKLSPSDASEYQYFGGNVSLYNDYALISSTGDDINGINSSGSVYIFKRVGEDWIEEAKLIPSDPTVQAYFGNGVSLYEDYAFIGASRAYNDIGIRTGAVYVFKRIGNEWIEQTKLLADDGMQSDGFARVIASENTIFIGAIRAAGPNPYSRGAGYFFKKEGEEWIQEHKLVPNDEEEEDRVRWGASFSGNYAAIANSNNPHSGIVHLFKKEGEEWEEKLTLTASNGDMYDRYGWSVYLKDNLLIVGAWANFYQDSDSIRTGAVYVYDLDILLADEEVFEESAEVNLFPNPSKDHLTVKASTPNNTIVNRLELYAIDGKLLETISNNTIAQKEHSWELDISELSSGTYIVKLLSEEGIYQRRFVKVD